MRVGEFLGGRQLMLVAEHGAKESLHAQVQRWHGDVVGVCGRARTRWPNGRPDALRPRLSEIQLGNPLGGQRVLRYAIGEPASSRPGRPNACASGLRTQSQS